VRTSSDSDKDDFESRFNLKFEELPGELGSPQEERRADVLTGWFSNSKIRFEIQVPTKTKTNLQTGGGHITVSSLEGDAHGDLRRPHRSHGSRET
jgi:hypothetical protein